MPGIAVTGPLIAPAGSGTAEEVARRRERGWLVWDLHLGHEPLPGGARLLDHVDDDVLARVAELAVRDGVIAGHDVYPVSVRSAPGEQPTIPEIMAACHDELGASPREVILAVKMRRAHELLASGRWRVGEVAEQVGFESPYHFSRRFKDLFGRPPSAVIPPAIPPSNSSRSSSTRKGSSTKSSIYRTRSSM